MRILYCEEHKKLKVQGAKVESNSLCFNLPPKMARKEVRSLSDARNRESDPHSYPCPTLSLILTIPQS